MNKQQFIEAVVNITVKNHDVGAAWDRFTFGDYTETTFEKFIRTVAGHTYDETMEKNNETK